MNALTAWYEGLESRERHTVQLGAAVLLALLLIGGLLLPLQSAVSTAVETRDKRVDDLAWMQRNASEVLAGAGNVLPDTGEVPVVLVDRVGRESGLGNALRGTQPSGAGVRVQLEGAPFDTLVSWLAALDERYGLSIDSITVDRSASPGAVNANITFKPNQR